MLFNRIVSGLFNNSNSVSILPSTNGLALILLVFFLKGDFYFFDSTLRFRSSTLLFFLNSVLIFVFVFKLDVVWKRAFTFEYFTTFACKLLCNLALKFGNSRILYTSWSTHFLGWSKPFLIVVVFQSDVVEERRISIIRQSTVAREFLLFHFIWFHIKK